MEIDMIKIGVYLFYISMIIVGGYGTIKNIKRLREKIKKWREKKKEV